MNLRFSLFELFLLETIAWMAIWLLSDYVAALLTLIIGAIVLAVLIIALISEMLERSKVPRRYFQVMAISVVSAVCAAVLYTAIFGGEFDFLKAF